MLIHDLIGQALVKDKLLKLVGPFPEKTPLNVKITGVLHKEGYRVEIWYLTFIIIK